MSDPTKRAIVERKFYPRVCTWLALRSKFHFLFTMIQTWRIIAGAERILLVHTFTSSFFRKRPRESLSDRRARAARFRRASRLTTTGGSSGAGLANNDFKVMLVLHFLGRNCPGARTISYRYTKENAPGAPAPRASVRSSCRIRRLTAPNRGSAIRLRPRRIAPAPRAGQRHRRPGRIASRRTADQTSRGRHPG